MAVEIKNADSGSDIDLETAQALGAPPVFELPPITAGKLALLDLLDSPLLTGKPMGKRDVWIALYVLERGQEAVAPINRSLRKAEAVERATEVAATSPEHAKVFLEALKSCAEDLEDFDIELMKFVEESGLMTGDATEQIATAMNAAMAGLRLIPKKGNALTDVKKNGSLMSTTSQPFMPLSTPLPE